MSRGKPSANGPWCWQSTDALRRIQRSLSGKGAAASGLLVYVALTDLASEERKDQFERSHGEIAARAGISVRTVQARLSDLKALGLVDWEWPLNAACRYRLLPAVGNHCRPVGNGEQQALPTYKELKKGETEKALRVQRVRAECEQKLVALCLELFGNESMENYGGAWRERIRRNHELVEKVLADVALLKREGKIRKDVGAAAYDLWKRWGGDK